MIFKQKYLLLAFVLLHIVSYVFSSRIIKKGHYCGGIGGFLEDVCEKGTKCKPVKRITDVYTCQ